jgi:hypothetical protein
MSPLRLNGSTSGNVSLDAPAVAGSNTIVLPTGNGSAYQVLRNGATAGSLEYADKIVSGTAVASTSGTSIDFTGIPSWVKRVTVMMNGVSTNGGSNIQIQVGNGSFSTSGYTGAGSFAANTNSTGASNLSTGFAVSISVGAGNTYNGSGTICLIGSNTWVYNSVFARGDSAVTYFSGGVSPALSGTLDRVRITTVNGTDTFDAGSINILYE